MSSFVIFFENILKFLVIIANGAMLLIVFGQVVTRYCFGWTPHYGEELARYLFVWVVFLALPLVAKKGGHMCIETLTSRFTGMKLKVLRILSDVFSISFLTIMVCCGIRMVELSSFQTSPAMQIPMSWVYMVIPFGCGIMLLYSVVDLTRVLKTPASEMR